MVTSPIVCLFSDPPFFVVRPQPYYQRQPTQSVTMPCVAEGDPKPAVTWRKVRHPYPHPHPHSPYTHTPSPSPCRVWLREILNPRSPGGRYVTLTLTLTLTHPTPTHPHTQSVTMPCVAEGDPKPALPGEGMSPTPTHTLTYPASPKYLPSPCTINHIHQAHNTGTITY